MIIMHCLRLIKSEKRLDRQADRGRVGSRKGGETEADNANDLIRSVIETETERERKWERDSRLNKQHVCITQQVKKIEKTH